VLYITGRTGKLSDEDKQREERARNFLGSQAKRAIELRSKEREFHGLEREFHYYQEQMIADYERSKDIKHPRDVGDAREEILRHFLNDMGSFRIDFPFLELRRGSRLRPATAALSSMSSFMTATIPLA
jgi:hypothetical protein